MMIDEFSEILNHS